MALFPNFDKFKREAKAAEQAAEQAAKKASRPSGYSSKQTPETMWDKILSKMGPWAGTVDAFFRGKSGSIEPAVARELEKALGEANKQLESTARIRPDVEKNPPPNMRPSGPLQEPVEVPDDAELAPNGELIEWVIVSHSSNVHSFAFQWNAQNPKAPGSLFVRFLGGDSKHRAGPGPLYKYFNVERSVFVAFKMSASKGSFVWDELRVRGSVAGHKYQYELAGTGPDGYVPRQASIGKRGRVGRGAFLKRTFNGQQSQLPEREFKGTRNITKDFRGEATRIRLERGKRP